MKTTIVNVNDTTPVLLVKGPCRCRFSPAGNLAIGASGVTYDTGYKWAWLGVGGAESGELLLLPGEKVFGITNPTAPAFDCVVLEYGTP